MAEKQKKMAAALAAVNAYLQDEEAQLATQSQVVGGGPQPQLSLWGFSARQETMNMRRLIQMRAFERCR